MHSLAVVPRHPFATAWLLVTLAATSACTGQDRAEIERSLSEARQTVETATAEGGTVARAIAEARRKLHEENLGLDGEGLPKAKLTPQGDLLIGGTAVPMDEAQREAALAYRAELLKVAEAGMVLGQQGAAIAGQAVTQVLGGLFTGKAEEAAARIEAEAKKIEEAALALCKDLEGLEPAQARFAELVPEFRPYAKKIQVDTDCKPAPGTVI
ncbi:hypothetical protein [Silanimonas lenta]|uniref:hypothetical protein n=1 Tax=Silanimonas lenta TaxID=265429 RepID=UPI0003F9F1ED|nr:hypothetical protein [Silanimonas lenta]